MIRVHEASSPLPPSPAAGVLEGEPPGRVLIIKPSAIGDVVHALPVLRLMRSAWPSAHIAWLVTPACAGLLEGHPLLSEVILFERKRFGRAWRSPGAAAELGRFVTSIRGRFDLVVDLQGLLRSGLLTFATAAPRRVGLASAREGAAWFYTRQVRDTGDDGKGGRHAVERYLDVAEALGLGRGPVRFEFNTSQRHRDEARMQLGERDDRPFAVLVPGANWPTKRYPPGHFAEVARGLRSELGLRVVTVGGPSDRWAAGDIGPDLDLCGKTSLAVTTAVLERAAVVISNDTGPMHIAAALGRPLVALFGPTSEALTGPYGQPGACVRVALPCAPCLSRSCSHQSCMAWLTPRVVLDEVRRRLGRTANGNLVQLSCAQ